MEGTNLLPIKTPVAAEHSKERGWTISGLRQAWPAVAKVVSLIKVHPKVRAGRQGSLYLHCTCRGWAGTGPVCTVWRRCWLLD